MIIDRTQAPARKPINALRQPHFQLHTLPNGNKLWYIIDPAHPVVRMEIINNAGTLKNEVPLQASFTNRLLSQGTQLRNAAAFAEAVDCLGSFMETDCDRDYASITFHCLSKQALPTLDLMHEMYWKPAFAEEEFELHLKKQQQIHKINNEKVDVLASRKWLQTVYKGVGYGAIAVDEDFDNIRLSQIHKFYQNHYTKAPVQLFLSGDINQDLLLALEQYWGNYPVSDYSGVFQQAAYEGGTKHYVAKADALQSSLRVGRRLFDRHHDDFADFRVLNCLFGGYFGSRLMSNLREDKGFTYGVYSSMAMFRHDGYFCVSAEVGVEVYEAALREIYFEMQRLCDEKVPAKELETVRNYMLGSMLKSFDGIFEQSDRMKILAINHLDWSFYMRLTESIKSITPERLRDLAQQYFNPDLLTEVVAGGS